MFKTNDLLKILIPSRTDQRFSTIMYMCSFTFGNRKIRKMELTCFDFLVIFIYFQEGYKKWIDDDLTLMIKMRRLTLMINVRNTFLY